MRNKRRPHTVTQASPRWHVKADFKFRSRLQLERQNSQTLTTSSQISVTLMVTDAQFLIVCHCWHEGRIHNFVRNSVFEVQIWSSPHYEVTRFLKWKPGTFKFSIPKSLNIIIMKLKMGTINIMVSYILCTCSPLTSLLLLSFSSPFLLLFT